MNMEQNNNILEIKDLHVVYETDTETVYAVNGIDLSLAPGKTLGIVGETGAGKTTTALSILRLLPQDIGKVTGGSITFDGKDLLNLSNSEMQKIRGASISMIFQDPMTSLNPVNTVGDQIYESLMLHNDDHKSKHELEERVDAILETVGIPKFRKKEYPHQFSGGMKQRIVIAIALACRPAIVIADEPTTALDVTIQAQVLAMMRRLKDQMGMAMILITHDLGVIAETCDDVAVMYAGEIVESGTMEDIFNHERHHPYTEGLFGSIPSLDMETDRLKPISGLMPDPTNLPQGCAFSPRCPYATDKCRAEKPVKSEFGTHTVACHLFTGGESPNVD